MSSLVNEHEAIAILSDAADEMARNKATRNTAAEKLIQKITELDGFAGFRVENENGGVWLMLPSIARAKIVKLDGGDFKVYPEKGVAVDVQLAYNAANESLESFEVDTYNEPVPGKPRQRRSGLSVLIEVAVSVMRQQFDENK